MCTLEEKTGSEEVRKAEEARRAEETRQAKGAKKLSNPYSIERLTELKRLCEAHALQLEKNYGQRRRCGTILGSERDKACASLEFQCLCFVVAKRSDWKVNFSVE